MNKNRKEAARGYIFFSENPAVRYFLAEAFNDMKGKNAVANIN
jgi:hypothetical protein